MPKKKTNPSKTKRRKRRTRRHPRKNYVIVLCFLFVLGLSIYSLSYIRNFINTPSKVPVPTQSEIENDSSRALSFDQKLSIVESNIHKSLLNLGLSKKNIKKRNVIYKKSDNFSWKFTNQEVSVSKSISKDDILEEFQKSFRGEDTKLGFYTIDGDFFSEVSVDGYQTHIIKFDFFKKKDIEPKISKEKKVGSIIKDIDKNTGKEARALKDFSRKKVKIAIIVDDIGQDRKSIEKLISISPKLSFAVLPHLPYSKYASDRARGVGSDVLLHLPMEPKIVSGYNADDAGEGVLLVGQSKSDIIKTITQNLSSVPNAVGVNNHMGSKFTENGELMGLVLEHLKEKGLFYVDSQTSAKSAGFKLAKSLGMKSAYRDVFLDIKDKGKKYVKKQLKTLVKKAKKRGYAIGICHPYPQTIEALNEELPKLGKYVEISSVSSILNYY